MSSIYIGPRYNGSLARLYMIRIWLNLGEYLFCFILPLWLLMLLLHRVICTAISHHIHWITAWLGFPAIYPQEHCTLCVHRCNNNINNHRGKNKTKMIFSKIQSDTNHIEPCQTAVITRSNISWYYISRCNGSSRTYFELTKNPHTSPSRASYWCLLWGLRIRLTAWLRYRTVYANEHVPWPCWPMGVWRSLA